MLAEGFLIDPTLEHDERSLGRVDVQLEAVTSSVLVDASGGSGAENQFDLLLASWGGQTSAMTVMLVVLLVRGFSRSPAWRPPGSVPPASPEEAGLSDCFRYGVSAASAWSADAAS
ncbi:hypothetical protein ACFQ46_11355, partial [Kineococcus sp. GCM10028916]|uniref:hypothetical protein n=1 Tax=Kineococcus sp. GCM10028916 TaxID=3273394 RepID=UPI003628B0BE